MFDSAPTLNIPFARKVLEHLMAHPEEHDQDFYGAKGCEGCECGTRACIAGTAVLMDSATTVFWDCGGGMKSYVHVDGIPIDIEIRAQALLGLDDFDGVKLFHEYSNKHALERLSNYITQAEQVQTQLVQ